MNMNRMSKNILCIYNCILLVKKIKNSQVELLFSGKNLGQSLWDRVVQQLDWVMIGLYNSGIGSCNNGIRLCNGGIESCNSGIESCEFPEECLVNNYKMFHLR